MRKENWSYFSVVLRNFLLFISILIIFITCVSSKTLRGDLNSINESIACFDFPSNSEDGTSSKNLLSENYFPNLTWREGYSNPILAANGEDCFSGSQTFSYFSLGPISQRNDLANKKLIRHIHYLI